VGGTLPLNYVFTLCALFTEYVKGDSLKFSRQYNDTYRLIYSAVLVYVLKQMTMNPCGNLAQS
jgi:hypothetical protein